MNQAVRQHRHSFTTITAPRYILTKIQECALVHLGLKDMFKLRDRMEGQLYYDRLKSDIWSEYAFEKTIGKSFDWEKRKNKGYKRKYYQFQNKSIQLIHFNSEFPPRIISNTTDYIVFIYIKPESKLLLSGLASKSVIESYGKLKNGQLEFSSFDILEVFSNYEELIEKLTRHTTKAIKT